MFHWLLYNFTKTQTILSGFQQLLHKNCRWKSLSGREKLLYNLETSDKMNSFGVYPQSRPSGHFYQCSRRRDERHLIKSTADTSPGAWSLSWRAEALVSGACTGYRTDVQEPHKTWQEQTSSPTQAWGRRVKHVPLTSLCQARVPNS